MVLLRSGIPDRFRKANRMLVEKNYIVIMQFQYDCAIFCPISLIVCESFMVKWIALKPP